MNKMEVNSLLQRALYKVAPEINYDDINTSKSLRDQVEMDSYDFYNLIVDIENNTGISIPERDLTKLISLDELIKYVINRVGDT